MRAQRPIDWRRCVARVALAAAIASLAACRGDPTGANCEADDDCGPGFDCYPDVCVRVCTKTEECPQSQTCYRYHCIEPGTENQPRTRRTPTPPVSPGAPPPTARQVPPPPDATIAELRAIRHELESIHESQVRIMAALQKQGLLPPEATLPQGGARIVVPGTPGASGLPPPPNTPTPAAGARPPARGEAKAPPGAAAAPSTPKAPTLPPAGAQTPTPKAP